MASTRLASRIAHRGCSEAFLHEGLCEVWRAGLVHGDIRPENIIVAAQGPPRLLDVGLPVGRLTSKPGAWRAERDGGSSLSGQGGGPEVDIRGFGATLYQVVTGRSPFPRDGGIDLDVIASGLIALVGLGVLSQRDRG